MITQKALQIPFAEFAAVPNIVTNNHNEQNSHEYLRTAVTLYSNTDSDMAQNKKIEPTIDLRNADLFEMLPTLQSDFYDLCIVDPPYGASTTNSWNYNEENKLQGFGGDWKLTSELWDLLSQNDSFQQTYIWLKELKRVIKPTGSIWIHSTYHNSGFVNVCCQLLGLEIINEVVWYKRNSFPNLSGRRLTASHETILWVHKGGAKHRKYIFNYEASKDYSTKCDLLKEKGKQMRTVWDIPNNKSKEEMAHGNHPTQKPIKVAERILTLCGVKNGNLLVPFVGSGTEMVAGLQYGMNVCGFELEQEYYDVASKRIEAAMKSKASKIL